MTPRRRRFVATVVQALGLAVLSLPVASASDWTQLKFDARHSGNAPSQRLELPLGLVGAVPLTDAIFTAPVVAGGRIYVVDGAGVAFSIDAETLAVRWKFVSPAAKPTPESSSPSGVTNSNNVSSPALAGGYLHFGTMAGDYWVLDADSGEVVRRIRCGEPIFSAPVVSDHGVYFATLGSRVHALAPDGTTRWTWDFVREVLDFDGDRWSGVEWARAKKQATWRHQFLCSRDLAVDDDTVVLPAGGSVIWLDDLGDRARLRAVYRGKRESPCTLGLSIGENGDVYRQWHRRDNNGSVEVLRLQSGDGDDGAKIAVAQVPGTETGWKLPGLVSFSSVSLRGHDVFRCRPQEGFGLCRHHAPPEPSTEARDKGRDELSHETRALAGFASISAPILLADAAVYGGLDGRLHVAPLDGGEPWSFATAFGKAITAPVTVCDGRVYFGCEDGYLYVLGRGASTPLPTRDLELHRIRAPLTGRFASSRYDWFTNFGNFANTNAAASMLEPPFRIRWIRRFKGTVKHMSVCGGGRLYTHTAEGQVFAVEQETGRLLWRRYFPGVHVSFTAPLYHEGRLLVPQAGLERCRLRCLDAATGELQWEAPFSGSPSWNRQLPPIVHEGLVIYLFSSGEFRADGWLFEHQSTFGFPDDHEPIVRAWKLADGEEVWSKNFADYGSGGDDAGMCLLDGRIYYSCYFGGEGERADEKPTGVTVALEPKTGEVLWANTEHSLHAGCTVSGKDGRLYLGGYNPVEGKTNRVWCLDARDGSLLWKSDPLSRAIHVVTLGGDFLFTHSQYEHGYLLNPDGKIRTTLFKGYNCTRFTLSDPYMLGPNLDVFDMSEGGKLISSGPAVDVLECVGAIASNGRLFYTTNGGGIQLSAE